MIGLTSTLQNGRMDSLQGEVYTRGRICFSPFQCESSLLSYPSALQARIAREVSLCHKP